jgi:chlorobactene lauroyltransferase
MSDRPFPPPGYPPPPSGTAARLFERYLRGQVRRYFTGVHWSAHGNPGSWDRRIPTIFVANHTNWWDGFLACLATGRLGLRFQVLMEARHLARYRVFLKVGALPMRRDQPRAAYEDLAAAAGYLQAETGLWIFPQGERRPPQEPLRRLERGVAHLAIAHTATGRPIRLCPVAFRYPFVSEQLPEAFVLVGEEWVVSPGSYASKGPLMAELTERLAGTIETLDLQVRTERFEGFRPLAEGKLSVNKRLDRFRHALGLLGGPFEARNG